MCFEMMFEDFILAAFYPNTPVCFSDAIVNQVLDELGLEIADDLSGLKPADQSLKAGPSKTPQAAAAAAATDADADLEARLENLKRQ